MPANGKRLPHSDKPQKKSNQLTCKPGFVSEQCSPDDHSSATLVTKRLMQPTRTVAWKRAWSFRPVPSLFGFAPGGVYHAAPVASGAVRSYRTLSPLPRSPKAQGGLLSVALSLGLPPPGVTRHRVSMEPGLSSPPANTRRNRHGAAIRPTGLNRIIPDWSNVQQQRKQFGRADTAPRHTQFMIHTIM